MSRPDLKPEQPKGWRVRVAEWLRGLADWIDWPERERRLNEWADKALACPRCGKKHINRYVAAPNGQEKSPAATRAD